MKTEAAKTAQAIKKELKAKFPGVTLNIGALRGAMIRKLCEGLECGKIRQFIATCKKSLAGRRLTGH